ncbi:MAG TPA: hypothetical protein VGH42_11805, partial [Verrucomicrobiae bacterium]
WSLVWPVGGAGLVQIENPYDLSSWTNAPPGTSTESHGYWLAPSYWAMKHFSYFINPGYKRVNATGTDNNVRASAFLSPDNLRLVVVLINTNASVSSAMNFNFGSFSVGKSGVYQTAGTNTFQSLGSLTNSQALPPLSLTTVVLEKNTTPPRITSVQLLGGSFAIAGTNGNTPGTYFYTLASTNLALPLTNWTVIATNQFGPGGGFNFTNTFDSSAARQFFILRIP